MISLTNEVAEYHFTLFVCTGFFRSVPFSALVHAFEQIEGISSRYITVRMMPKRPERAALMMRASCHLRCFKQATHHRHPVGPLPQNHCVDAVRSALCRLPLHEPGSHHIAAKQATYSVANTSGAQSTSDWRSPRLGQPTKRASSASASRCSLRRSLLPPVEPPPTSKATTTRSAISAP